jgi:predicted metal-dependent phosphoesterase TrpH
MTQIRYDLHCHSTASDGSLTPTELIQRAIENQVDVLALTDHDTLAGLDEAHQANAAANHALVVIDGVEISTSWHGYDIHIVGLNLDRHSQPLLEFLALQSEQRDQRAEKIGARLEKAGLTGAYEGAKALAASASITRGHYARWLISQGYADTPKAVFNKYLSRGKTGYVANQWASIEVAIAQIHAAGGLAVLAHPCRYQMKTKWLRRLITHFKEVHGDALEVQQSQQPPQERQLLSQLAHEYDLKQSLGSDFHQATPWIDLGRHLGYQENQPWLWLSETWQQKISQKVSNS